MGNLAAQRMKQAALLFVILPRIPIRPIDIELVPAHGELIGGSHRVRDHHTAIVDAAVAGTGDAVVGLQLEIGRSASLPDDEGVALDYGLRRDLANQRAVFYAPVLGVAFPSRQSLAVEHR